MPSVSIKQRRLMAIAEHHPSEVSSKNRGILAMSHQQLHDFADTSEKNLPLIKKATGKIQKARRGKRKES